MKMVVAQTSACRGCWADAGGQSYDLSDHFEAAVGHQLTVTVVCFGGGHRGLMAGGTGRPRATTIGRRT